MLIDVNPMVSIVLILFICYGTLTKRGSSALHFGTMAAALVLAIGTAMIFFLGKAPRPSLSDPLAVILRDFSSLCFIFPVIYLFKESLSEKIFLFFMTWGFAYFVQTLCAWVEFRLGPGSPKIAVHYGFLICCYAVLLPLYFKYWRYRIQKMLALFDSGKPLYVAFPCMALVLFVALFHPESKPADSHSVVLMALFECLVLLAYYILFSHFFAVCRSRKLADDLKRAERRLRLQIKYYGEMEKGDWRA